MLLDARAFMRDTFGQPSGPPDCPFVLFALDGWPVWQKVGSRHAGLDFRYVLWRRIVAGNRQILCNAASTSSSGLWSRRGPVPSEGLNYFRLCCELDIRDAARASGLFSPDHTSDYLGTTCTDGTTCPLTSLRPGIEPLNLNWLADYRSQVPQLGEMSDLRSNEEANRQAYDQLKTDPTWGYQLHQPSSY